MQRNLRTVQLCPFGVSLFSGTFVRLALQGKMIKYIKGQNVLLAKCQQRALLTPRQAILFLRAVKEVVSDPTQRWEHLRTLWEGRRKKEEVGMSLLSGVPINY